MSFEARIHADVVFHERSASSFTVGSLSDHVFSEPTDAQIISGTAGDTAEDVPGQGSLTTLAIKNTGTEPIRVADGFDLAPGRMAVIPTTATVSVVATVAPSTYTAIWIG